MKQLIKDLSEGAGLYQTSAEGDLWLDVPAGVRLAKPLFLTNQLTRLEECDTQLRFRITLGRGSVADVVTSDRSAADLPFHTSRHIDAEVAADASLHFCNLEELGPQCVSENAIRVSCSGNVSMGLFSLSGGESNNTLSLDFAAGGASCELFGMTIASGHQQMRNAVTVTHHAPHCTDRELFKQILDEEAVGRFEGLVNVRPQCPGADSQQTSRNICLSRAARAYAQPQLIIDTDDVRCSHGATVGQLDEMSLFYMQQRGIPRHEARLLLLSAFLAEVIDKVTIPSVRDRLQLLAESRLRGELNHCVACAHAARCATQ